MALLRSISPTAMTASRSERRSWLSSEISGNTFTARLGETPAESRRVSCALRTETAAALWQLLLEDGQRVIGSANKLGGHAAASLADVIQQVFIPVGADAQRIDAHACGARVIGDASAAVGIAIGDAIGQQDHPVDGLRRGVLFQLHQADVHARATSPCHRHRGCLRPCP